MSRSALGLVVLFGCAADSHRDRANGTLDPWQAGPPMLLARANHCVAVIDDWILVIGGNRAEGSGFVKTAEIDAAQLAPDGTVGPWQVAGQTASPVSECNATADGRTLYVIDGLYDTMTDAGQIFTADLDATGMLAPLTSVGALPAGQIVISSEAAVRHGELLLMHTLLPSDPDGDKTVTLRTPATSVAWATDDWQIGFRAQAQYSFTDTFAYTIGGYLGDDANTVTPETFFAPIGSDGTIGTPAKPSTALPTPTAFGEAVAVDQWMFVAGGRNMVFGAPGTTTVVASPIAATGELGAWTTLAPLPMPRTNHKLSVVGDYLVLTGGADNGPGDTTVLTARVRF